MWLYRMIYILLVSLHYSVYTYKAYRDAAILPSSSNQDHGHRKVQLATLAGTSTVRPWYVPQRSTSHKQHFGAQDRHKMHKYHYEKLL